MVDVEKLKQLIVAMFKKGMTLDQVKARLQAANLEASDELISESASIAGIQLQPKVEDKKPEVRVEQPKDDIPAIEITSFSGGEEKTVDLSQMLGKDDKGQKEADAMFQTPSQASANLSEMQKKVEDLVFRIKALEEVNKQILSTLKEVLYKLK